MEQYHDLERDHTDSWGFASLFPLIGFKLFSLPMRILNVCYCCWVFEFVKYATMLSSPLELKMFRENKWDTFHQARKQKLALSSLWLKFHSRKENLEFTWHLYFFFNVYHDYGVLFWKQDKSLLPSRYVFKEAYSTKKTKIVFVYTGYLNKIFMSSSIHLFIHSLY